MYLNMNSAVEQGVYFSRVLYMVLFVATFLSCRIDEELIPKVFEEHKTLLLTEYWEEGDLLLQFNFDDTVLIRQVQHQRGGTLDFKLEYNNFNYRPNRMSAEFNNRILQLQFDYNSRGQVQGYTFFVDRYIRYVVRLFYNDAGLIYELRKYWPLNGELVKRHFEWEGGNIIRVEQSSNFIESSNPLIIEFKYDEKNNPFNPLFELIGFNVIEDMPLTVNNPIEINKYWKKTPNKNELSKIKYAYDRFDFPFVKEIVTKDSRGVQSTVYGEYRY